MDGLPGYDAWLSNDPNDKPRLYATCTLTLSVQVVVDCELDMETRTPICPDGLTNAVAAFPYMVEKVDLVSIEQTEDAYWD